MQRTVARLLSLLAAGPAAIWIVRQETIIQRLGRPLRPAEFDFACDLGIAQPEAVRILAVSRIPSPLGGLLEPLEHRMGFALSKAAGVTLGYGIYVVDAEDSLLLVTHELAHVRQYERLGGPLPFILRYFYECLAFGYEDSPLEREAVELSRS